MTIFNNYNLQKLYPKITPSLAMSFSSNARNSFSFANSVIWSV